jgi:hypothetical protein
MPASFEDVLAQARPVTRTVRLCLRGDLLAAREQLERQLFDARAADANSNALPTAPAIADRLAAAEAEADAAAVEFVFRALSRRAWIALLDAHPPTDKDSDDGLQFNAGFPAAAISACAVEPEMTVDQVEQLLDRVSTAQYDALWIGVLSANVGADDIPKSVAATAVRAASGTRSTTAPDTESLGASS